ncbi:hypothetical protein MesloDRAFT_1226 [Mesorhizobium japonicum R7A]|nr:hypothetical protein MesloDRAFT_1226 [Mesorhizobium japonicum R7A]
MRRFTVELIHDGKLWNVLGFRPKMPLRQRRRGAR